MINKLYRSVLLLISVALLSSFIQRKEVGMITGVCKTNAFPYALQYTDTLYKPQCQQTDSAQTDSDDAVIIKTCFYGKYKLVNKGYPDYKGRYSWAQEVFVKSGSQFKRIENTEMFDNKDRLLSNINRKLRQDYDTLKADPRSVDCWTGWGSFVPVKSLNDLKISFTEDTTLMQFVYNLGMSGACYSQDLLICTIKLEDINFSK